jgi:hypothetical protein
VSIVKLKIRQRFSGKYFNIIAIRKIIKDIAEQIRQGQGGGGGVDL